MSGWLWATPREKKTSPWGSSLIPGDSNWFCEAALQNLHRPSKILQVHMIVVAKVPLNGIHISSHFLGTWRVWVFSISCPWDVQKSPGSLYVAIWAAQTRLPPRRVCEAPRLDSRRAADSSERPSSLSQAVVARHGGAVHLIYNHFFVGIKEIWDNGI